MLVVQGCMLKPFTEMFPDIPFKIDMQLCAALAKTARRLSGFSVPPGC